MRYTVVWTETALGQLARVWTDCPDRGEVNREVDRIDAELGQDPETKGDDYFGDRYLLFPVMCALFTVVPDDRIVRVLQVGRTGFDLPYEPHPHEG